MFISVIIPTRNRVESLRDTLEALAKVSYPPESHEVIVVDTASTDGTPEFCRQHSNDRFQNFRYERTNTPGLHVGRHRGADVAAGEVLLFGDDDILPHESWLSGVAAAFADVDTALVGGNIIPQFEVEPPSWLDGLWQPTPWGRTMQQLSLIEFEPVRAEISPLYVYGCNYAIRKAVLRQVGGFHPDALPGNLLRFRGDGETAVSQAIEAMGFKTVFHPDATVVHRVAGSRLSMDYMRRRAFADGISASYSDVRRLGRPLGCSDWARKAFERTFGGREHGVPRGAQRKRICTGLRVRGAVWKSMLAGYRFHQREMRRDPELLRWVLQPDYWQENTSVVAG